MHLAELPLKAHARVAAIGCCGDGRCAARMREMGFAEGIDVEILHKAPFGGDPLAVRVGGTTVAIRRAQAKLIALDPA